LKFHCSVRVGRSSYKKMLNNRGTCSGNFVMETGSE
jgi:hypothetical protein